MPYVTMTKDFSEVKKPVAAGLTLRQIICFSVAGAVGIPVYMLTKDILDKPCLRICFLMAYSL